MGSMEKEEWLGERGTYKKVLDGTLNENMIKFILAIESELGENPTRVDIRKAIDRVLAEDEFEPTGNMPMVLVEQYIQNRLVAKNSSDRAC